MALSCPPSPSRLLVVVDGGKDGMMIMGPIEHFLYTYVRVCVSVCVFVLQLQFLSQN